MKLFYEAAIFYGRRQKYRVVVGGYTETTREYITKELEKQSKIFHEGNKVISFFGKDIKVNDFYSVSVYEVEL